MSSIHDGMRILVTGANGFIGGNLVSELSTTSCGIIALYGPSPSFPSNHSNNKLLQKNNKLTVHYGDIKRLPAMYRLFKNINVVCHLAGISRVEEAIKDPQEAFETNVLGTLNVFNAAIKHGIRRFIFASSATVYGDEIDGIVREEFSPRPANTYARSKYLAEQHIAKQSRYSSMQLISLRLSHVYGPRQGRCQTIPGFILQAIKKDVIDVPICRNKIPKDDFIYVNDVVNAIIKVIHANNFEGNKVINISSGISQDLQTVAQSIKRNMGIRKEIRLYESKYYWNRVLDNRLASQVLNWSPEVSFETGIQETVNWYINNSKISQS